MVELGPLSGEPVPLEIMRVRYPVVGGDMALVVACAVHGTCVFPLDSVEVHEFAREHAGCHGEPGAPVVRGRAERPPARKSRLRAVSILSVPAGPVTTVTFAPEPAPDVSWVQLEQRRRRP